MFPMLQFSYPYSITTSEMIGFSLSFSLITVYVSPSLYQSTGQMIYFTMVYDSIKLDKHVFLFFCSFSLDFSKLVISIHNAMKYHLF